MGIEQKLTCLSDSTSQKNSIMGGVQNKNQLWGSRHTAKKNYGGASTRLKIQLWAEEGYA